MKVLVTGGSGFIGSHIVDSLVEKNEVVVVDKKTGFTNPKAKYIVADILDLEKMKEIAKEVDQIFHYAANPSVQESVERPSETFELNVTGTINMLEAARYADVKTFVFASSSTIYGNAPIPTKETTPTSPVSPYGASKAASDAYIAAYSRIYGFNAVSCVYGNIFGPRSDHGVMFDFFHKLVRDPKKLEILGDGKQQKTYLFISETVDATLLCADKVRGYDKFNISSEEWITVNDIARIISDEMDINPKFVHLGGKTGWVGDIPKFKLDISKIKSLGWEPKISTEEGIRNYIRYLKSKN